MVALESIIKEQFSPFRRNSPSSWKKDSIWAKCSPIFVTLKYGQNIPIDISSAEAVEAMVEQWDKELDYSKIELFSFALATQVRLASFPNDGIL